METNAFTTVLWKVWLFFSINDDGKSLSEDLFNRGGVCLPSDTKMTNIQQERVIKIIKDSI